MAACGTAPDANNQVSAAPARPQAATPLAVAERLVRQRVAARGEARIVEARARSHDGVTVICGAYEQAGSRHRYIVVDGQDVFVEPDMRPGEMPRAIDEFCAEGGRA